MASAHVCQGACLGAHGSATGTSSTAVGTNAGGSALDAIRPTVGGSAMGDGQAGNLELNAVDGGGAHGWGGVVESIVARMGADALRVPRACRSFQRHRWRGHPSERRRLSHQ